MSQLHFPEEETEEDLLKDVLDAHPVPAVALLALFTEALDTRGIPIEQRLKAVLVSGRCCGLGGGGACSTSSCPAGFVHRGNGHKRQTIDSAADADITAGERECGLCGEGGGTTHPAEDTFQATPFHASSVHCTIVWISDNSTFSATSNIHSSSVPIYWICPAAAVAHAASSISC